VNRVAVRIVKRGNEYHVIGRETSVVCQTFDEAWEASVPYFRGYRMDPIKGYRCVR
jgi:hypothetical protein